MKFPKHLNVAFYNYTRIFEFYNDTLGNFRIEGVEARLLETLSEVLGFTFRLVTPEDGQWASVQKNGMWDGLIGEIPKGRADMALGLTWITEERQKVVDFSTPYYFDEVTFSTRLPGLLPKTHIYILPFDFATWIGILVVWLCFPVAFHCLYRTDRSYSTVMFGLYANFLRQPIVERGFDGRLLLACWRVFALVVSLSYAGVLSSFLTVQLREVAARNFEELSVTSGRYDRIVTRASVVEDLLKSDKSHVRKLGEMIVANGWTVKAGSSGSDDETADPKQVNIFSRSVLHFLYGKPPLSSRFISEDALFPVRCGIAMKKEFCCKAAVDFTITRIQSAGIYGKFMDDELYKKWLETSSKLKMGAGTRKISVGDVRAIMVLLVCGYLVSSVALVMEICLAHYESRDYS